MRITLTAFLEVYSALSRQIGSRERLRVTGCPELKGQKFSSGACMQRNFVLYNNYVFYMLKL
jgi:hypothetical protein